MENENQEVVGISFKDIINIIKRSWVSILVCVILGAIICTGVLSIVRLTFSNIGYEAKFTVNNKYIINGMSPWNTTYSPNSEIKSGYVVNKALEKCEYSEDQIASLKDDIINNLSVNAIVPEGEQGDVYSYSYKVVLEKPKTLNISDAKAIAIVDAIVEEYISFYKQKYELKANIGKIENIDFTQYNYVQIYENLSTQLDILTTLAKEMSDIDLTYRSTTTKLTFNDILSNINAITVSMQSLTSLLTTKAVINTQNKTPNEVDYINMKYTILNSKVTILESQIAENKIFLENIKPEITVGSSSSVAISNEEYYNQVSKLFSLQAEVRQIKADIEIWNQFKNAYSGTIDSSETTQGIVNTVVNDISTIINTNIDNLQQTIADYNEENLLKNAIKKTSSGVKVVTKNISNLLFIVIELIIFAIAVALGILINNIVIKKKQSLNS